MKIYKGSILNQRHSGGNGKSIKNRLLVLVLVFSGVIVNAQQLQSYIQEAEANNPELQAYKFRYEAAREKVNEANTLPDTEFSAGYFVSEPETRTGPQKARFSVRQMLPWFGTITARENYAGSMADAEFMQVAIARRKLGLSVAQTYYNLYANRARQKVLLKNIRLLETFHELALNSLEVGNASAVDVLRLQMRQNELAQQREILEQEFSTIKTEFNNLLNRSRELEVAVYDSLTIPETDLMDEEQVTELHPELLRYDELYKSVTEAEVLNQKEALPKIGLGMDYVTVAERTDMNMTDNGKDILMPMVSLSVPIFNNRYKSVTRQNELRQRELEAQREDRYNQLENMLEAALNKRASARVTANIQQTNLEQAYDAEEILVKSYETGTVDFNDVLDVQELQLRFQINLIEAVKNYYQQSAIINYLSNN